MHLLHPYNSHKNIIAKLPKKANQLIGSYLFDYQFENNMHECPYMDVKDMFNIEGHSCILFSN